MDKLISGLNKYKTNFFSLDSVMVFSLNQQPQWILACTVLSACTLIPIVRHPQNTILIRRNVLITSKSTGPVKKTEQQAADHNLSPRVSSHFHLIHNFTSNTFNLNKYIINSYLNKINTIPRTGIFY